MSAYAAILTGSPRVVFFYGNKATLICAFHWEAKHFSLLLNQKNLL